jgi:hypothetical protein
MAHAMVITCIFIAAYEHYKKSQTSYTKSSKVERR